MKRPLYFPKKNSGRQKTANPADAHPDIGADSKRQTIVSPHRAEQIQNAVYQIAQATNTTDHLQDLFYSIHQVLGTLMPAQNFFIALYDPATEMISYPYYVDEKDLPPAPQKLDHGLTAYLLRTGQPILASPEVFADLVARGEAEIVGADSIDWLGVPLIVKNQIIGILALQSYTPGIRFSGEDLNILVFVSNQVAMAIERKSSEQRLRDGEARYRAIVEDQTDMICRYRADGTLTFVNQALCTHYGLNHKTAIGQSYFPLLPPEEIERSKAYLATLSPAHPLGTIEHYALAPDGDVHWTQWTDRALYNENGQFIEFQSVGRDITQQKRRQQESEAIASLTTALRPARTRSEMAPIILDQLISLLDAGSALLAVFDPFQTEITIECGKGKWEKTSKERLSINQGLTAQVIESQQAYVNDYALEESCQLEFYKWPGLQAVACVPLATKEQAVGALWIGKCTAIRDSEVHLLAVIADMVANTIQQAYLHEQTQQRLQRLTAVRSIDMAITSSLDLTVTLNILIDQVISQLGIHAADLLLLNPYTQLLEYSAGQGFRTNVAQKKKLHLGQGYAGRVALERQAMIIPDLSVSQTHTPPDLIEPLESFRAYVAVPLISKGKVKGVLELFQRAIFAPDSEWLEFMQSLAAQAAIAIDNAELLEGLQRSNSELSLAYAATIEGWSRALEARDREIEGHTHRLAELTLMLVQFMGIKGLELEQVRWGVLLHDIGKMVLPDQVLFKPGPFDEEEREMMQMHPVFAYEMLSPIPYLRQAIDIPYCHHEKWDGSGYPRHLQGGQIPLTARIFAVVDVWDALTSERPFRPAWPLADARQYIRDQAGKHFDPVAAEAFLKLEQSGFKSFGI
jgi:PAS domain S-box-containing protein